MTISGLYKKVASLNIEDIAVASMKETKAEISRANIAQMEAGFRPDGSNITPPYTANTIRIKQRKGQITSHVTLKDRGDFHDATFTLVDQTKVIIGSSDFKSKILEDKYGPLFGIGGEFQGGYVREELRPVWQRRITEKTGLKFS